MKSKIIHGHSFNVSQPYAAGHSITEAEAKALNQVRSENIGNNLREQVKKLIDEANVSAAEALVAEYDAQYTFAMGVRGERRVVDPIEREARKIAREQLKIKLAEQNLKINVPKEGYTQEQWDEKMEEYIDKIASNEVVLAEAKKAVNAKKKQADALAAAISLDA